MPEVEEVLKDPNHCITLNSVKLKLFWDDRMREWHVQTRLFFPGQVFSTYYCGPEFDTALSIFRSQTEAQG